jgi:hypothetical protein
MIHLKEFSPKQIIIVFVLSFLMGCGLIFWFEHFIQTEGQLPLGVDIYPRWVGGRAFWQGESPYTAEVDQETQSYVFGRPALPDEDTFGFYYPSHIAIVLAPLFLLPARQAALLWTAMTWAILSVIVFLIVQSVPGRASPWLLFLVAMTIFFQRSALLVTLNGQYVFFILACWGIAYYLICRGHDLPAGFLLALSTIKPSLAFLPLLVFLFWTFRTRRWKVILAFFMTSILFLGITFVQIGWWIPEFLAQLGQYDSFPRQWVPINILSPSGLVWLGGTAVLIFLGIREHIKNLDEFPWVLFWGAISLILLVTPHTADYDMPVLLLPFILYAPHFLQTKSGAVIWTLILWVPWLTWGLFMLRGQRINWFSLSWFHYPQILVIALLVYLLIITGRKATYTLSQESIWLE